LKKNHSHLYCLTFKIQLGLLTKTMNVQIQFDNRANIIYMICIFAKLGKLFDDSSILLFKL
jgi:hypothetical protein